MEIIRIDRLSLQFDGDGRTPEDQAREVVEIINAILRGRMPEAQLIAAPDEIEVSREEVVP